MPLSPRRLAVRTLSSQLDDPGFKTEVGVVKA